MTARLALLRWVSRIIRKEWRQHLLVIAMITFGITLAVVAVVGAVRLGTPGRADLANAEAVVTVYPNNANPDTLSVVLPILERYPDAELRVVGESQAQGEGVTLFYQDPAKPLGAPWLDLLEGRYPQAADEIVLSQREVDRAANTETATYQVGNTYSINGQERLLVGIYENPLRLSERLGLVTLDGLGVGVEPEVLLPSDDHPAFAEFLALQESSNGDARFAVGINSAQFNQQSDNSALGGYVVGTLLCFLIAILASAGFTVLANRRIRQLGMLAAMGARPSHLGSVMRLTGVLCGVIGGVAGLALGVVLSIATTPLVQTLVDHRLAAFDLPWLILLPALPLAVVMAVLAAWWPARRVRSISAVDAMAARPPKRTSFVPSLVAGLGLLAAGSYLMVVGAPKNSAPMVVGGIAALVFGALFVTPGAVAALGMLGERAPLPIRIAWRDAARNHSRSVGAVAAAAIAIAVPFSLASFVASLSQTWVPEVPDNMALVSDYPGQQSSLADLGQSVTDVKVPAVIASVANAVPGSRLVPLISPIDQVLTEEFSEQTGDEYFTFNVTMLRQSSTQGTNTAIATPELLDVMGLTLPTDGSQIIATFKTDVEMTSGITSVSRQLATQPGSFPQALVVQELDGVSLEDGLVYQWLLVNDEPFTQADRDRMQASSESFIYFADSPPPFIAIRSGALAVGGLLALAVVAVAVALIRVESVQEDRVLNSVGADPSTSRSISGATVAGLVLTAAAIAIPVTFLGLLGVYRNPDEQFSFAMPWIELFSIVVVLPMVGAGCAWLLTSTSTKPIRAIS